MDELREMLQRKLEWVDSTCDATHANVRLTRGQLDALVRLLEPTEMVGSLPKIEPRLLSPQEPRGTRRSPEEVRAMLGAMYNGGNPYNNGGEVLANLRAQA